MRVLDPAGRVLKGCARRPAVRGPLSRDLHRGPLASRLASTEIQQTNDAAADEKERGEGKKKSSKKKRKSRDRPA
ncbi:MAG TPA: hypothetical protein VLN57_14895 [Xanthobacteraceae bacterium]|nr:hypothetical protein [Xanthobacteraceae bacterium]